jgi:hypothetical protein
MAATYASGLNSGQRVAAASRYARSRRCAGDLQACRHRFARGLRIQVSVAFRAHIDIGARRHRHAPPRHRRRRIQLGRLPERPQRFVAVEAVKQRQPLVEELLRFGVLHRDGMVPVAHPLV